MKEAVTKVIDTLTQEDFHGTLQLITIVIRRLRTVPKGLEAGREEIECSNHLQK